MKESSLLDLKDIFDIPCAKIYNKFKHGTLPSYFEKFLFKTIKFTIIIHEIGKISTGSRQNDHALMNVSVIIYQP